VTVLQGRLLAGRGVGLASTAGAATVKKIVLEDGSPVEGVEAGQSAVLTLLDRSGRSGEEMALREGMVLCKGPPLARPTRLFKASIHTLPGLPVPIIPGSAFELYLHGQEVLCRVERIYSMGAGETKVRHPKSVPGGRSAYVLIRLDETQSPAGVCIEPHDECPALARFALRARGVTSAVGVCRRVKPL
jgi:translation elongation factor EF-1alpha